MIFFARHNLLSSLKYVVFIMFNYLSLSKNVAGGMAWIRAKSEPEKLRLHRGVEIVGLDFPDTDKSFISSQARTPSAS